MYTLIDHDGYIPAFAQIIEVKVADLSMTKLLKLPSHYITVMGRG